MTPFFQERVLSILNSGMHCDSLLNSLVIGSDELPAIMRTFAAMVFSQSREVSLPMGLTLLATNVRNPAKPPYVLR